MKWTAADVVDALREAFGLATSDLHIEEWSLFTEVPLRCPDPSRTVNERIIDVLLVRNWTSGRGHERLAVEVKVSRSDYRNETDHKRAPAEHTAHRCAYAAPAGLIDPATLPPGWGLIEVYDSVEAWAAGTGSPLGPTDGTGHPTRARWAVRPERRQPGCDMDHLVAAVGRPGSRALERMRRAVDEITHIPRLRAEVEKLSGMLERRDRALARETARAKAARAELLALDGATECADCAQPVTWVRGGRGDMTWAHLDPLVERACREDRTEANRRAREAATGARYLSGFPDPVEPRLLREARLAQEAADAAADAAADTG